jgi:hypothetical protein
MHDFMKLYIPSEVKFDKNFGPAIATSLQKIEYSTRKKVRKNAQFSDSRAYCFYDAFQYYQRLAYIGCGIVITIFTILHFRIDHLRVYP